MQRTVNALNVLSAMITPAVLISACGTLVFSTSNRLARIVDRVRELIAKMEQLSAAEEVDFPEERRHEIERQLEIQVRRSRYIQRALTSFYVSLGMFVGTTVAIGIVSLLRTSMWLPNVLGIVGTLVLFYGCMMLIVETRMALQAINMEMAFTLMLSGRYHPRPAAAPREAAQTPEVPASAPPPASPEVPAIDEVPARSKMKRFPLG
ncbi:MAG TPA: DUF2721 domain-containing protein [Blastocatellia bacterium]|nr:DUF2721 domain-containing protein [Blastocatellia bacterium]